jgi:ABC-type bacteriocin/lantibiotic exporter with double-glycine peptidase domain
MRARARLIVPEVVQTSNMDCGPATLKCLLEGFGIRANYGRLREACQTDVDGTSIDTMEEVACELGLNAEQIVVPLDHVLLDEAECLPAIAVVVLASGVTHFVVVWRRHGRFVQVMDPAAGRRFVPMERFRGELFVHRMAADAAYWRDYAGSEQFLVPLRARLAEVRDSPAAGKGLLAKAMADPGWRGIAALDAAVRTVTSLIASGAIERGAEAIRVLDTLLASPENIPEHYWFATAGPDAEDGTAQVMVRGAVLVRATGRAGAEDGDRRPLSPELIAALEQPPSRPGRDLIRLLRADGVLAPAALVTALALASGGVLVEAVLLRGLVGAARQTITPLLALTIFSFALLLVELPLASGLLRLGRRLEIRLRLAFLRKIPRLGDRYFQSRLKSDMAERSHSIHLIRRLPELGGQLLRSSFELVLTTAGIIWLDPASAPIALLAAFIALAIPIAAQPILMERDLRLRTHSGALSHFYLDALLGLFAIHSHGAQPAVRRSHESLLVEWARAGLNLQRLVIALESVQFAAGFGLAIWLLTAYLGRHAETGAILLLVYWALNLPALGQEVAIVAWQYPSNRNVTLRLLEPLGAIEQSTESSAAAAARKQARTDGVSLLLENVTVRAAGHTILRDVHLDIPSGQHVAIVGHSGAGKSSLVGILLGWHRVAEGRVLVDGKPLDEAHLASLRREIAWVDPAVHVWNRSLEENLRYGCADGTQVSIEDAIEAGELAGVLRKLPHGIETPLGEAGGLLSGGEGQRVRFARALMRPGVRLAILDEPFRGLDLDQRRSLLERARNAWRGATLLCITHDVAETLAFERVLVIENGRIIEDGQPAELAREEQSRFRALLDADRAVHQTLWMDPAWRHVRLESSELREQLPHG